LGCYRNCPGTRDAKNTVYRLWATIEGVWRYPNDAQLKKFLKKSGRKNFLEICGKRHEAASKEHPKRKKRRAESAQKKKAGNPDYESKLSKS
jgi:hypothetical protein